MSDESKQENLPLGDKPKEETKPNDEVSQLKATIAELQEAVKNLSVKKTEPPADMDLNDKVQSQKKERTEKNQESAKLEAAIRFNLSSDSFIKNNDAVLTSDVKDIFEASDKESFDSEIDKANATKSSIIKSFFSQQENIDFLTETHKVALEDYLKLTKNAREEKADYMFRNILEPTLSMIKRVNKAEQAARANAGLGSDTDQAYAEKMRKHSEGFYFRKGA